MVRSISERLAPAVALFALARSTSDKSSVVKELGRGAYSTETTEPTLGPVTMAQLCK